MTRYPAPPALAPLLESRDGKNQGPVEYDPDRWARRLHGIVSDDLVRAALEREDVTTSVRPGRRTVTRGSINDLADAVDLADDDQVLSLWLLVLAWGNGTRSQRGFQNAANALERSEVLLDNLRRTATILRAAEDTSELAVAHRAWRTGFYVRESFFSKWFAFAGRRDGRGWQPLVLDENVWHTLNGTLGLTVADLAGSKEPAAKYQTYVELVHEWAGSPDRAQWIEWVLFRQDGTPNQDGKPVDVHRRATEPQPGTIRAGELDGEPPPLAVGGRGETS